jgi:hypothetical protein
MNGEWSVGQVSSTFFMIYPTSFCLFMKAGGNECKGSKKLHQSLWISYVGFTIRRSSFNS